MLSCDKENVGIVRSHGIVRNHSCQFWCKYVICVANEIFRLFLHLFELFSSAANEILFAAFLPKTFLISSKAQLASHPPRHFLIISLNYLKRHFTAGAFKSRVKASGSFRTIERCTLRFFLLTSLLQKIFLSSTSS